MLVDWWLSHGWLFCGPTDCSPPGSSVCGISKARILEWVAIFLPRGSSQPRDWICISYIVGRFFSAEPLGKLKCDTMLATDFSWIIFFRLRKFPSFLWLLRIFIRNRYSTLSVDFLQLLKLSHFSSSYIWWIILINFKIWNQIYFIPSLDQPDLIMMYIWYSYFGGCFRFYSIYLYLTTIYP